MYLTSPHIIKKTPQEITMYDSSMPLPLESTRFSSIVRCLLYYTKKKNTPGSLVSARYFLKTIGREEEEKNPRPIWLNTNTHRSIAYYNNGPSSFQGTPKTPPSQEYPDPPGEKREKNTRKNKNRKEKRKKARTGDFFLRGSG